MVVAEYMNDVELGLDYARQALALARRHEIASLEASAHNNIGMCLGRLHRWADALRHFEKCLVTRRRQGDRSGEATTSSNIAAIHCLNDDLDAAWKAVNNAVACARDTGDRYHQCTALLIGTEAHLRRGRHRDAMVGAQSVLSLARTRRNGYAEAFALWQLAKATAACEGPDDAERLHKEAVEAFAGLARRPDPILEALFGRPH